MKSIISTVLAAAVLALPIFAEQIYFAAESEDGNIYGPLSSIHEGAGFNYFLISSGGTGEIFDLQGGFAVDKEGNFDFNVGEFGGYFAAGPAVSPEILTFTGDVLDTHDFWACLDTNDPYQYSEQEYIIAVSEIDNGTAPFENCTAVTIWKNDYNSSLISVSSYPSSLFPLLPTTLSTESSLEATHGTVTNFTTFCPAATEVTITRCNENQCSPTIFTVSEETTLTVLGECVLATVVPTSVSVVLAAGAERAVVGFAGLVGFFAFLF